MTGKARQGPRPELAPAIGTRSTCTTSRPTAFRLFDLLRPLSTGYPRSYPRLSATSSTKSSPGTESSC